MLEYGVTYPCSVCGEPIVIDSNDERKAVVDYMEDHGWAHEECFARCLMMPRKRN